MPRTTSERTVPVALPAYCTDLEGRGFYAVTVEMTMAGLRLRAPRIPRRGETVECRIRNVDPFEARVVEVTTADFVVKVGGKGGAIARQLIDAAGRPDAKEIRVAPRFVPDVTSVVVTPESGNAFLADIVNLSASGVAVRSDRAVQTGSTIVVGRTRAKVVRGFEGGFGAAFATPFEPAAVDRKLVL